MPQPREPPTTSLRVHFISTAHLSFLLYYSFSGLPLAAFNTDEHGQRLCDKCARVDVQPWPCHFQQRQ